MLRRRLVHVFALAGLACLACIACTGLKSAAPAPDASAEDAGPGTTFCDGVTPTPDFCDDFDRDPDVVAKWANANRNPDIGASGGGVIGEELAKVSSAPRAASLSLPALVDSSFYASAILHQGFTAPLPPELTIEMELLVDTEYFTSSGVADILVMSYAGVPELGLLRRDSGTWLTIGNTAAVRLTTPIVVGTWATLTLIVENKPVNGADGRVQVLVNHRRAADVALPARLQSSAAALLDIGPVAKGPIGAFRVIVDNVRVWRRSDL